MEPQKNVELPKVEGGVSNSNFESPSFDFLQNHEAQSLQQNSDILKSREAVFSAVEEFSVQGENLQATQQAQVLPQVQGAENPVLSAAVPAIAADVDLMEDEWVKDLKKMIVETKGDPHARQNRFKEMQMDYLKKRYNRIINGGK